MTARSLALLLLALAACRPPARDLPVCLALVSSDRASEADTRLLPPEVWFQVLVPGVTRPGLVVPDAPRECSGRPLAADVQGAAPLPRRPLVESDLTFGEGPEGQLLVWARVEHYADGTALGPIALAKWVERGLEIRGIGTLWAPARRTRLRIEPLGDAAQVLVADGERCSGPDHSTCARELVLLPLVEQRFVQAGLSIDGAPAGPARVLAAERRETLQPDGWVRRAEVQRRLRVVGAAAEIQESIQVRDCDPNTSPEQCQERLNVRDSRPLALESGRFATTRSAWSLLEDP